MPNVIAGTVTTILDVQNTKFKQKIGESNRSLNTMAGTSGKLGFALKAAFTGAVIVGVSKLVSFVKRLAIDSLKLAARFQTLKLSLTVLVGDKGLAQTLIKQIKEMGSATPFTTESLFQASRALLAFGFSADEVIPTLRILGDVSAGTGKDLKSLAVIFGQIKGVGKLTGERLNQLSEAGFNPLTVISKRTGRSIANLREDMRKGLITFSDVKRAFEEATGEGGAFEGMMEKLAETFAGKLSTVKSKWDELKEKVMEPFLEPLTEQLQRLADELDRVMNSLDGIGGLWEFLKMMKFNFFDFGPEIEMPGGVGGQKGEMKRPGDLLQDVLLGATRGPWLERWILDILYDRLKHSYDATMGYGAGAAGMQAILAARDQQLPAGFKPSLKLSEGEKTKIPKVKPVTSPFERLAKTLFRMDKIKEFKESQKSTIENIKDLRRSSRDIIQNRRFNERQDAVKNLPGAFAKGSVEAWKVINEGQTNAPDKQIARNTQEANRLLGILNENTREFKRILVATT